MNYDILVKNIDLKLLREQKEIILNLQYRSNPNGDNVVNPKEFEALNGIISLIDYVQDQAVVQHNLDENDVFEFKND
jgi:hypothetical protein